ncbi:MAG: aldo/keto reductase [Chloroflexi bacterium]|nr:aldo/keto reductase [Chloroflexota bacterium]
MAELKKRRLGRTKVMVTELGLGTLDTAQVPEGEETLHLALDLGVNFIDTARIYEGSEYLIGQVLRKRGDQSCYLATKTINRTRDGAQYDIDRSLRLLGRDRIDLYQLDDVSPESWEAVRREGGALEGLQIAQFLGKIAHIGISSHHLGVLEQAITCGEFDTVMLEYSAFSPETERLIGLAQERDVGVIVMRPLGGSGRMTTLRGIRHAAGPERLLSPAMLLRYVLSHPGISVAIPGARYPSRVRENVDLALTYHPLDDAQKRACEAEATRWLY